MSARTQKFAAKYELNFPLLVDPDKAMLEAYGAWAEKQMYGKRYMGVARITYSSILEGTVAKVWPKVRRKGMPKRCALRSWRCGVSARHGDVTHERTVRPCVRP
jgi:peroxiredoxin